jgi:hypothetical protein
MRPLLLSFDGRRGRPLRDARSVMEGTVSRYRYRCRIVWHDLQEQFGVCPTMWQRNQRCRANGNWDRVLAAMLIAAEKGGLIDRAVSAHPPGTTAGGESLPVAGG